MKRLIVMAVSLLVAGSLMAGEGKSCNKSAAKSVQLTGTVACKDGSSGEDCQRVFRVANSSTEYTICSESKAKLTAVTGSAVRISGKIVSCGDGQELMIEKAAKI
ncbi:MAG: hypothetical protein JJE51_08630 [Thermoanaerobaculia bacterium]|nr:hypothetical protein [Thermoanaerobaculia bacterium]